MCGEFAEARFNMVLPKCGKARTPLQSRHQVDSDWGYSELDKSFRVDKVVDRVAKIRT